MTGFWTKLPKPIFALAPMANVTDAAFRRVIAKYGKPDVMFSEFVSCEGLCSEGRERLLTDLWFTETERPIVAQFFGAKPEMFYRCAQLAQELGFDGIDINMGCPDKAVLKQGAGAALIKTPELAKKIILETKRGAGALPVSIKTRIGYLKNELQTWLPHILETEPAAVTIHARTMKEMSKVPARWDTVTEAREITEKYFGSKEKPLILGNGDVMTLEEARARIEETGADGVMIGRGIFGNPWCFARDHKDPSIEEKLRVMLEHTRLFEELFLKPEPRLKNFDTMKKHYKAYVNGFDGAKELRIELMAAENSAEVAEIIKSRYPDAIV